MLTCSGYGEDISYLRHQQHCSRTKSPTGKTLSRRFWNERIDQKVCAFWHGARRWACPRSLEERDRKCTCGWKPGSNSAAEVSRMAAGKIFYLLNIFLECWIGGTELPYFFILSEGGFCGLGVKAWICVHSSRYTLMPSTLILWEATCHWH